LARPLLLVVLRLWLWLPQLRRLPQHLALPLWLCLPQLRRLPQHLALPPRRILDY